MNCNARRCTILYEAFQVFKNEGIHHGRLGAAPLAGLDDEKADAIQSNAETC